MNVKLVIIQLLSSDKENEKMENIQRSVELCENYIEVYEKISPGYTKWRGHILELQSAALLKKSQLEVYFLNFFGSFRFRFGDTFLRVFWHQENEDRRVQKQFDFKKQDLCMRLVTRLTRYKWFQNIIQGQIAKFEASQNASYVIKTKNSDEKTAFSKHDNYNKDFWKYS